MASQFVSNQEPQTIRRVAIMQPYFYPYIGYFQLISSVHAFVFYDDVNFIKSGWINRNRINVNGRVQYITVPCKQISSNKFINDTAIDYRSKRYKQVLSTIELAYKKAPYFDLVYPVIAGPLDKEYSSIAELASQSVLAVCNFLGLNCCFKTSSVSHPDTVGMSRTDRLITIARREEGTEYVNLEGGVSLYKKEEFAAKQLQLQFVRPVLPPYHQASTEFVAGLSVIDVLMNNSKEQTLSMLNQYELF